MNLTMAKMRIAVIFGGVSSEHEISCISASSVIEALPKDKYDIIKIGITKNGRWLMYPGDVDKILDGSWHECPDCVPAVISPDRTTRGILTNNAGRFDNLKLDFVFPVLHGRNGEDGTVQGLLDLCGIPYVGCDLLSSAMCLDKATANRVFAYHGIPHTPFLSFTRNQLKNIDAVIDKINAELKYPLFVKPSNGGSSLGISRVQSGDGLASALRLASGHDNCILVEQGVKGSEVECAVLGNSAFGSKPLFCSVPGQIVSCKEEMYDYEAKYLSGDASKVIIPAPFPKETLEEVRRLALKAYTAMGCCGLSRVDFFISDSGEVIINEINTIPGFTSISMYSKLMAYEGYSFPQLLDKLIDCAKERFNVE